MCVGYEVLTQFREVPADDIFVVVCDWLCWLLHDQRYLGFRHDEMKEGQMEE